MREIKFRSMELDSAVWRYGSYVVEEGFWRVNGEDDLNRPVTRYYICENGVYCDIAPDTVGQFTGLNDCDGVDIYEGDILKCHNYALWVSSFVDGSFIAHDPQDITEFVFLSDFDFEVVGNIHQNPELLEQN